MNPLKPLFFEQTLRHWHFEALIQESKLSRERVHFYLRELLKQKFITRIKPRSKMPYYVANKEQPSFRMEKRFFGLSILQSSGLFDHIYADPKIKTALLFGSFARGDWGKSSDVDLFLFGDDQNFEKERFELLLKRELQVFSFYDPQKIKEELNPALIPNITKGFNIKGNLEPFEVMVHA